MRVLLLGVIPTVKLIELRLKQVDATKEIIIPKYIVDKLIPMGSEIIIAGKSACGKSLFSECLLTHLKYNLDFLGLKTVKNIDSLLIDEDTPTDALELNLRRFDNALNTGLEHNEMFYYSMCGLSIADDSLFKAIIDAINEHPKIGIIVIDCLHKIGRGLNMNDTSDMSKITTLKRDILDIYPDITIILIHHISEHKLLTFAELMTKADGLLMGNSIIQQDVDGVLILAPKKIEDGKLKSEGVRVITKRFALMGNFMMKIIQSKDKINFIYDETPLQIEEIYDNIMQMFKIEGRKNKPQSLTFKEIYNSFSEKYARNRLRDALDLLVDKNDLKFNKRKPNVWRYELVIKK